jgi:hypothetical protein
MRARRPGATLLEGIVAAVIALLIFGAMMDLFLSIRRMSHAGDLSATLAEASLAMAQMHRDLAMAVSRPGQETNSPVLIGPSSFQLLQNQLDPGAAVRAKVVMYRAVATGTGNFRLQRSCEGEQRMLPGIYRSIEFVSLRATGGPFVRITLRLSVHDTKGVAGKGSEEAVVTALARVAGPELVSSDFLSWDFLDGLKSLQFGEAF